MTNNVCALIILFLIIYPHSAVLSKERGPLSLYDIEILLKGNVDNERIVKLVTEHGVSFIVTEDVTNKLRDIGADNTLIKTIKKASGGQYPQSRQAGFAREKIEELSEKKGVIKVMQITGEIIAVDAKANTLKVKGRKGDVIIICDDKTKIMAGSEKKTFADIAVGDKVTVKYTENDGKNVAKSIAIKQAVKKDKNRDERVEDKSEKKNGRISIMSYPKGIVFVNGKEIGYTPLEKVEIPVGQNEILVKVNGNEQKKVVTVREDETVEASFQFDRY